MSKILCFIHTDTNNLHKLNEDVTKKKLYTFARMVRLNYEIGKIIDNKFIVDFKKSHIVKPRSMHIANDKIHGISQIIAEEKGIDPEIIFFTLKS